MDVTVTIDTEEEWDWSGPFPVNDFSVKNIAFLPEFQALCDQFGIRPTYFVNHAVLDQDASRGVITQLARKDSVEIGMHIHPWNTPPIHNAHPLVRETFAENLPPDLLRTKLQTTLGLFQASGMQPRSFRGGRYSSGPQVRQFLAENGFLADASICPLTTWQDDGAPDYRRRGLEIARQPISHDGALWDVPLTRAFTHRPYQLWARAFQTIEQTPLRHARLIGILERTRLLERVWLNFECEDKRRMLRFLRIAKRHGLPHLCFTVHSSSLTPGPGPYCRSPADQRRIFEGIENVFAAIADDDDLVPVTMTELISNRRVN